MCSFSVRCISNMPHNLVSITVRRTVAHFGMNFSQGYRSAINFPIHVQRSRVCVVPNSNEGHLSVLLPEDGPIASDTSHTEPDTFLSKWSPPTYLWRGLTVLVIAGQVITRILKGKVHWKNTLQQLERVGPKSSFILDISLCRHGLHNSVCQRVHQIRSEQVCGWCFNTGILERAQPGPHINSCGRMNRKCFRS